MKEKNEKKIKRKRNKRIGLKTLKSKDRLSAFTTTIQKEKLWQVKDFYNEDKAS